MTETGSRASNHAEAVERIARVEYNAWKQQYDAISARDPLGDGQPAPSFDDADDDYGPKRAYRNQARRAVNAITDLLAPAEPELHLGDIYRNELGGELHAVQRMRYLSSGHLLGGLPAFVATEVWLMESRSEEYGDIPYLIPPAKLAANGYTFAGAVDPGSMSPRQLEAARFEQTLARLTSPEAAGETSR